MLFLGFERIPMTCKKFSERHCLASRNKDTPSCTAKGLFLSTDKTAYDLIHSFIIRLVSE